MAIDHTNCTHPRTPAGRRACRNMVSKGTTLDMTPERSAAVDREVEIFSDAFNKINMTGPVARRMARTAAKADAMKVARIQPRRSGARVSANNSSCVQAALHTRGRCACGWENWEAA